MKFIIGSRVIVNGYTGTITDYRFNCGSTEYQVEFDDTGLIGNRDWYGEDNIFSAPLSANDIERCPVCRSIYIHTKSPVQNTDWFDCPRCKLTKEKIEENLKNNNSRTSSDYSSLMINTWNNIDK